MNSLPELIENANLRMGENRAFLETADKTALIALDYKEQEKKWITTASDNYQSPPLQPNRTESGLNTSPSSASEASGDLKNSTTKAQKSVFQKLNPNQLQAQKLEAQAKEARERQNARAIADKRAQILRDKEQAEGKSVLEATMLTKQDDIPYTPLKETSIALDNTQPFNAHYAIININDIKPNLYSIFCVCIYLKIPITALFVCDSKNLCFGEVMLYKAYDFLIKQFICRTRSTTSNQSFTNLSQSLL